MSKEKDKLVKTFVQNALSRSIEIWVDKETGVNCLYHGSGYIEYNYHWCFELFA